jgi:hypothetical protein
MTGRPPGTGAAATVLHARSATSSDPVLEQALMADRAQQAAKDSLHTGAKTAPLGSDIPTTVIRAHSVRRCSNWPAAGRPVVPTKSGRPIMPTSTPAVLAVLGAQRPLAAAQAVGERIRGPQHRCIPGSGTNREKAGGTWPQTGKKAFSARSDGLRFPSPRRDPERYCCRYAAAVRRLPPGPTSRSGGTAG